MEYRLATAKEKLHSAKVLLESGGYKDSVGRSYYAMFTSVRAILALDKVYSKYLSSAFQIRNNCDYADFFLVSYEDAMEQYEKTDKFVAEMQAYLDHRTMEE